MLSLVNTALRDGEAFPDFCARYDAEEEEVRRRLNAAGFYYDEEQNAFKRT